MLCVLFSIDAHIFQMAHSLKQSLVVLNITAEHNLSSVVDIALLSVIIEMLTDEAMFNAMVIFDS